MGLLSRSNVALIVAGYVLGAAAWYSGLPADMPPSFNRSDGRTFWIGTPIAAFLLPTAAAFTYGFLRRLTIRNGHTEEESGNALVVYDAIMLRVILFVTGVHVTMLAGLMGRLSGRPWAAQIVPVMLGATMIGVGNLLPRTRPNLAIGIRTARTLSDRAVWIRTHRISGHLIVVMGAIIVAAAIVLPPPIGTNLILLVGPLILVGVVMLLAGARRAALSADSRDRERR